MLVQALGVDGEVGLLVHTLVAEEFKHGEKIASEDYAMETLLNLNCVLLKSANVRKVFQ